MNRVIPMAAATAALLGVAACGPSIQAGADYDPDTRFSPYGSFTWGPPDALPTGDPRLDNNPFFVERVREAVEEEFAARGIRHAQGSGALMVHFHASVRDRTEVIETDRRLGYDVEGYPTGTQVVQYEEGTLLVDVADAGTRELLWRGWAQADLQSVIGDPERTEERVRAVIDRIFAEFPVAEGAGT